MLLGLITACSPVNGFTEREANLINSQPEGEPMRLFTVDDEQDLLVLRRSCDPVEASLPGFPEYGRLLRGMLTTVSDPANAGVGIAAPQVGISKRIIAVQRFDIDGEPFGIYLNPRITEASVGLVRSEEGCLSIPDARGLVMRHRTVTVEYNDPGDFTLRSETVDGFTAIVFQHEIDHLNGILFTDKIMTRNGED
ncbi:MAG: peptide deformylase [Rikenellaceae bacterium]|nr:peptide deformylase [Rikenellaceae bacterium]